MVTTQTLTEGLQQSRLTVVAVDPATGGLRVRGGDDTCAVRPCRGRPERIVVLRRVWEELASPEL